MSTKDATSKPITQVTTGLVRLSYANIWKATAVEEGNEPKFSSAILIPKSDTVTLEKIEAALDHLKAEAAKKFGGKTGKLPVKFKLPLRDGDEEKPDDEAYAGHYFLNASSKQQPGIVGLVRDENNKLKRITDEAEVYSGCYARVSLNFYIFDVSGNKGIAAGLNNIQKVKDGEPLAGRSNADADFDDEYEGEDGDGMLD
jgi:hypothetical protein